MCFVQNFKVYLRKQGVVLARLSLLCVIIYGHIGIWYHPSRVMPSTLCYVECSTRARISLLDERSFCSHFVPISILLVLSHRKHVRTRMTHDRTRSRLESSTRTVLLASEHSRREISTTLLEVWEGVMRCSYEYICHHLLLFD